MSARSEEPVRKISGPATTIQIVDDQDVLVFNQVIVGVLANCKFQYAVRAEVSAPGFTYVKTIDRWPPGDKNPAGFLVLFRKPVLE